MSLFMKWGVNQAERELRVFRLQDLTKKQVLDVHRDTKDRRVAVRERKSVGYHSSPLRLLVGLEPSGFARISHTDQHRQGHEDRESDLDPSVG
jgi:hypothetical protein